MKMEGSTPRRMLTAWTPFDGEDVTSDSKVPYGETATHTDDEDTHLKQLPRSKRLKLRRRLTGFSDVPSPVEAKEPLSPPATDMVSRTESTAPANDARPGPSAAEDADLWPEEYPPPTRQIRHRKRHADPAVPPAETPSSPTFPSEERRHPPSPASPIFPVEKEMTSSLPLASVNPSPPDDQSTGDTPPTPFKVARKRRNGLLSWEIREGWLALDEYDCIKKTVFYLLEGVLAKYIASQCQGCRTNQQSQREHACLYIPDEYFLGWHFRFVVQELYTADFIPSIQYMLRLHGCEVSTKKVEAAAEIILLELEQADYIFKTLGSVNNTSFTPEIKQALNQNYFGL